MTEVQRLAKIMVLKDLLKEYELLAKYNGGTDYDRYCALEMAIKELEQESVLDKIRAEINSPNRGTCDYFIVDRIEEIIDKYKAESEVEQ